jgi:hypothetical protein
MRAISQVRREFKHILCDQNNDVVAEELTGVRIGFGNAVIEKRVNSFPVFLPKGSGQWQKHITVQTDGL